VDAGDDEIRERPALKAQPHAERALSDCAKSVPPYAPLGRGKSALDVMLNES
jgi:hypothetical protein